MIPFLICIDFKHLLLLCRKAPVPALTTNRPQPPTGFSLIFIDCFHSNESNNFTLRGFRGCLKSFCPIACGQCFCCSFVAGPYAICYMYMYAIFIFFIVFRVQFNK